jgi:hypothetical protein
MLSLPNDGRYPALDLLPEQRRQRTMEALLTQVQALASQNPVLMIVEDAHWIDPTSLEVFSLVVNKIRTFRALVVVTFRPEFEPPWIGRSYVTPITINRLDERDMEALIDRVVGNQQLPSGLRQDIIERSDGIPLFVEEMTKAVLEAGSQATGEHIVATALPPPSAVPASLQASLMARLDRLGPAKEVAPGARLYLPMYLSHLAHAHSEIGNLNEAWRYIDEAIEMANATKERWCEAEVNRIAGEIALKSPERDKAKAEEYFERTLTVVRRQQAKSWELRAAMRLARLRRNQGRPKETHEVLTPVYSWFTEGFDTRDLMEAKALLNALTL